MAIEIDAKGKGVSVVTLAGHDAGNFMYTQDLLDLAAVLTTCVSDKELRALVITGRGNTFCGGRIGAKGLTRASEVAEDLNAILKVNNVLNALRVPVIVFTSIPLPQKSKLIILRITRMPTSIQTPQATRTRLPVAVVKSSAM